MFKPDVEKTNSHLTFLIITVLYKVQKKICLEIRKLETFINSST